MPKEAQSSAQAPPQWPLIMEPWLAGGLAMWRFAALGRLPRVVQATTTRHGGVSRPPFDTLNLAYGQDDSAAVEQNLERLRRALGLEKLLFCRQTHGSTMKAVDEAGPNPVAAADGLATDRPGLGLLIKTADCQAIVLADPGRGVVANLHVGWRGNAADFPGRAVAWLARRYSLDPGELYAGISPSLGPCCAQFVNYRRELPEELWPFMVRRDYFDLWAASLMQLTRAGMSPERIEVAGLCTRCGSDFFSYRRRKRSGRFGTVVALKTGERP